jgi:hypothetical protein
MIAMADTLNGLNARTWYSTPESYIGGPLAWLVMGCTCIFGFIDDLAAFIQVQIILSKYDEFSGFYDDKY